MLYLVTNRRMIEDHNFLSVIKGATNGGVDAIILREKDLSYKELLGLAKDIQGVVHGTNTRLIINNSLEVANAVGAHGYHTGFQQFIEKRLHFQGGVGVSVHSIEEGIEAENQGASYLLVGHIFETNSKKNLPPKGITFIEGFKKNIKIPIVAIGGINAGNIQQLCRVKVDGVAVMSEIMMATDPHATTAKLKNLMK
ncbi:Thiamine-phosphate diphosphorylase [Alkaliphilus metalliredigens QYMF]|uniref:Thiamine-phosphate synthase n=1 Tax=Alkaliphilus metalliredigens (strain QYMF) TaxID=293826 RepID=A6TVU4_ALKMQ|nr:thiamine phosphate synthase [Alkaliphilus metalliredigens]ABR50312.1 Thiamine-phosphate diphosphorylase [Alkaliphilus metalliredigens QYMF]